MNVDALLRSPLGRILGRWLDKGPPGLEIRLHPEERPATFRARYGMRRYVLEIRNRGARAAVLTELGILDGRGDQRPLPSPELVLKPGAVARLRVELPDTDGRLRAGDADYRAYAVDRARRQFLSA